MALDEPDMTPEKRLLRRRIRAGIMLAIALLFLAGSWKEQYLNARFIENKKDLGMVCKDIVAKHLTLAEAEAALKSTRFSVHARQGELVLSPTDAIPINHWSNLVAFISFQKGCAESYSVEELPSMTM
jgi:hypothetical protein